MVYYTTYLPLDGGYIKDGYFYISSNYLKEDASEIKAVVANHHHCSIRNEKAPSLPLYYS